MNYEAVTDLIDNIKEDNRLTKNLMVDIIGHIVKGEPTPTRTTVTFNSFYTDRLDVVTSLIDDLKENGVLTHNMKMCIIEHIIILAMK